MNGVGGGGLKLTYFGLWGALKQIYFGLGALKLTSVESGGGSGNLKWGRKKKV